MVNCRWLGLLACWGLLSGGAAPIGDLSEDNRVDQVDLTLLTNYLAGTALLSDAQLQAADLNGDGRVDRQDQKTLQGRVKLVGSQGQVGLESSNTGRVVDQATGQPLAGVTIEVPNEGIKVVTDQDGRFILPSPVAPDRILTARRDQYAPFSLTVSKSEDTFALGLQKLTDRMIILEPGVRHLGDNRFAPNSANASDLRLPSSGSKVRYSFAVERIPDSDPYLKIGSLIGLDKSDGLQILLNGSLVRRVFKNGDGLSVAIPRWLLKIGRNELALITPSSAGLFDRDDDDLEFANLVLMLPQRTSPPIRR